jgi:diguanylate cyclase (GGDEF)-like protein
MRLTLSHPPIPRSRGGAIVVAVALVALIGWLDAVTGFETSVVVLYLLPVVFLSWILGRWWGLGIAAAGAGISLAADLGVRGVSPLSWVPLWNALVQFAVFAVVAFALAALRASFEREQAASRHDFLTGLPNYRALAEAAEAELARVRRFERPITVAYMDCDHFKQVNDTYGHATGDELLREVAEALAATLREVDTVARLGGDEFVVLLPETTAEEGLRAIERMRECVREVMTQHGWPVTLSFGVATFVGPPPSVDAMLSAADRLLYRAKQEGRDRAVLETYGAATA